jgi:hypothetical protein
MSDETETFVLPAELEPWRDEIEAECGGLSVETLLNDHITNGFNNAIKSALISMVDTKVRTLSRLYRKGQLVLGDEDLHDRYIQQERDRIRRRFFASQIASWVKDRLKNILDET